MRVVSTMQYRNLLDDLAMQKERADRAQQQISSGSRIVDLKDDPLAAGQVSDLDAQLALADRFTAAGDTALAKLHFTDTTFTHMLNLVNEAVTTGAASISLNNDATFLQAQSDRVLGIRDELLSMANSQHQGSYIFSGTATLTQPFPNAFLPYQGDANAIFVRADQQTIVQTNIPGDAIFQGADPLNAFQYLTNLSNDILANNGTAIQADMTALQGVFDRMNSLQTTIGNAEHEIESIKSQFASSKLENTTLKAKLSSANLAESITDMTLANTAIQASLQSGAKILPLSLLDYLG